jgi:hypothetical protein
MQGTLYSIAHNEMFGTNIQQVAILMVDREGNFQDFIIEGDEYKHYEVKALDRVTQYYQLFR